MSELRWVFLCAMRSRVHGAACRCTWTINWIMHWFEEVQKSAALCEPCREPSFLNFISNFSFTKDQMLHTSWQLHTETYVPPDSTLSFLFLLHASSPQMPIQFYFLLTMKWEISSLWMHQVQCQLFDSCWCLCEKKEGFKKMLVNRSDENILAVTYWKNTVDIKTEVKNHIISEKWWTTKGQRKANSRKDKKTSASMMDHSLKRENSSQ